VLYFTVSDSVDECGGILCQHVLLGESEKSPTRQLLDGCRELLQRLAVSLGFGLELRPAGRSWLEDSVTVFQSLDVVFLCIFGWDTL
jgi:hypothetical protein